MFRNRLVGAGAVTLVALLLAGAAFLVHHAFFAPKTITAYFPTATAIYPGDEVRISGVKVGSIDSIEPAGTETKLVLHVDHDVPIPADAKAVIVAQNLISARYVQLAPAYRTSGPTMGDGAVIGSERTAVPVEWDEVKTQLTRLAHDLGPQSGVSGTSASRFIDSAANAMDGNGEKLRQTLAQLSGIGRILADGSGNIVDIITNLQTFVTTLRDSDTQIVQFQNRLATLSNVLNGSRSDMDATLKELSTAVVDVQRFIAGTRDKTSEQVRVLGSVTQTLVDHQIDVENVFHIAPTAFANAYNMYNPDMGSQVGAFTFANMANPVWFICNAVGSLQNITAPETGKLCAQYLGPALRLMNFNYLPFPLNPYLVKSANPDNLIYSDPRLAPGGGGVPNAPEPPPVVSAYTGLDNDVPPPAGYDTGPYPPPSDRLPAAPSPALYPGAPIPGPSRISDMLLPPENPLPAEGTP